MIVPLLLIVMAMQAKLTVAFNTARTRVGEMLSEVSESVMGAAVVRAYGLDEHTDQKVKRAIDQRYRAEVMAHFRAATLWPLSSVFYALALSRSSCLGAFYGPRWGMSFGQVTAFLFLADVFLHVFTDLPEVYSETQTAIAGLAQDPGGATTCRSRSWSRSTASSCRAGRCRSRPTTSTSPTGRAPEVLHGISLSVPAGGHVAIVGETGCGKTHVREADLAAGRPAPRARC